MGKRTAIDVVAYLVVWKHEIDGLFWGAKGNEDGEHLLRDDVSAHVLAELLNRLGSLFVSIHDLGILAHDEVLRGIIVDLSEDRDRRGWTTEVGIQVLVRWLPERLLLADTLGYGEKAALIRYKQQLSDILYSPPSIALLRFSWVLDSVIVCLSCLLVGRPELRYDGTIADTPNWAKPSQTIKDRVLFVLWQAKMTGEGKLSGAGIRERLGGGIVEEQVRRAIGELKGDGIRITDGRKDGGYELISLDLPTDVLADLKSALAAT